MINFRAPLPYLTSTLGEGERNSHTCETPAGRPRSVGRSGVAAWS
ncbi:hypothetical protein SEA_ALVY_82 [Streptomyces phage Alvy]|uniref:Uncharacterized protein n=1 Tax=Streptomyces phage Alvy TaxID=2599888 RepID=A0A5J6TNV4_9CAUD|nr:hypothetical protein KGG89_gp12 [Streptomyces phage Alvy]QFG12501.1 hypothetical protein SEA_ALVY_82 [Streptomyces phage Alvy]